MSKTAWLSLLFGVAVLALIVYSSLQLKQYSVEVCMSFAGRENCAAASGTSREEAVRTATDTACAPITNGMTESIQCSNTPPKSVKDLD